MPELEFCQIDTKGSGSYCPVEIWPSEDEKDGDAYGRAANIHNSKVLSQATIEYLNRLLALQKELKEKYEPQLITNTEIEGEDPDDMNFRKEEKEQLEPGADNLYYT